MKTPRIIVFSNLAIRRNGLNIWHRKTAHQELITSGVCIIVDCMFFVVPCNQTVHRFIMDTDES